MKSDGSSYMGTVSKTASGKSCLAWNKQTYNSADRRKTSDELHSINQNLPAKNRHLWPVRQTQIPNL
jgi:hypothetical protein